MKRKAFTLIELLIVVAIIGILAAIAVPNFLQAQVRAKIANVQSVFKTMVHTIELYRIDQNEWPLHINDPRQNYWMTSPIAYTSQRPIDIFQDFHADAQREAWAHYGPKQRYGCPHYETGIKNGEYWIVAIGPDKKWQTFGNNSQARTFDVSNGINSHGDMYVFNSSLNYIFH